MTSTLGIIRYEYRMSIRRLSLWVPYGILMVLFITSILSPVSLAQNIPTGPEVFSFAGSYAMMLNMFMPVVGGILAADRLVRDKRQGTDELLGSTSIRRRAYLLGKYLGVLFSISLPVFVTGMAYSLIKVISGAPVSLMLASLVAFLGVNLPAFAMITAFSLVCPLVLPVRIYQVLFTGYWFWGNYLSPEVMPTLSNTYLSASGSIVVKGLFGGFYAGSGPNYISITDPSSAVINLVALAILTGLALTAGDRILAAQERKR